MRTASGIFTNLAHLVGCPSEGATTFIQTTNKNHKIMHYYDENGVRKDVKTTTAQWSFPEARVPASNTKK